MYNNLKMKVRHIYSNVLFKNSYWGIISHISQTILLSLFFIIIARKYSTTQFANYIIAITLYQLVAAFSTLGLSQWFIREVASTSNRKELISNFLKMQIYFGIIFYIVNIAFALLIYDDKFIRLLAILCGANIIFDNSINAIKCLNIADYQQIKSLIILTVEAFLKLVIGCFLFVYPFSIITLCIILIVIRFITLNLFLKYGSSSLIDLNTLWNHKISFPKIKHLVYLNWPFIVIGSVSMVNWRIANIIISKTLTVSDIANYEISYKIFSIAQLLPVIVSASFFPLLIKLYNERELEKFRAFYKKVHLYYFLFGLLSYTFIYSFSDLMIPLAFGSKYGATSVYTKQMFFTILVFPTAYLQANALIAMKFEKYDMWLNVTSLLTNISICVIGLHYIKSLAVITFSIFLSFLFFHILQDILLLKINFSSVKQVFSFYIISLLSVLSYVGLSKAFNPYLLFITFWICAFCFLLSLNKLKYFVATLFSTIRQ